MKALADELREVFKWYDDNPAAPDNDLLGLAKITGYEFQKYGKAGEVEDDTLNLFMEIMKEPELAIRMMEVGQAKSPGTPQQMMQMLAGKPDIIRQIVRLLIKQGKLSL